MNNETKSKDIVESLKSLNVMELDKLIKELQEQFGIDSSQLVGSAPSAAVAEESTPASSGLQVVKITSVGNKINLIKLIKETCGLGLGEAKTAVEGITESNPFVIPSKGGLKEDDIKELIKKIEATESKFTKAAA